VTYIQVAALLASAANYPGDCSWLTFTNKKPPSQIKKQWPTKLAAAKQLAILSQKKLRGFSYLA
jgi:hypothetical protein